MAVSTNIHYANSLRAGSVSHSNSNAISIYIDTAEGGVEFTLFGLPTDKADYLARVLNADAANMSEEAIRSDEHRKVAERIGLAA